MSLIRQSINLVYLCNHFEILIGKWKATQSQSVDVVGTGAHMDSGFSSSLGGVGSDPCVNAADGTGGMHHNSSEALLEQEESTSSNTGQAATAGGAGTKAKKNQWSEHVWSE